MPPKFQRKIANHIEYLEVPGDSDGVSIVLFHGYGADAFDLFPLSQVFRGPPAPRWIFPFGHLEIPITPEYTGKAWFPINIENLRRAIDSHQLEDVVRAFPAAELLKARQIGQSLIDALNIPSSKLVLGGFSQGAILATELALHAEESCSGLIILSGTLVDENEWKVLARKHAAIPFFQSHGKQDPILPFERAQPLEKILQDAGLHGKLHAFQGGHEIPQSVILQLRDYFEFLNRKP